MTGSTILVVYQDESLLERIRAALSPVGYDICPATSPEEAITELQHARPRVVVLSPCVTPAAAEAVARAARQLHPDLPVLRLSPNHVDRIGELLQ